MFIVIFVRIHEYNMWKTHEVVLLLKQAAAGAKIPEMSDAVRSMT